MIISNLIPALGWTLLHSLWQGGLLFLLAAPLFQLLKSRSPELRYGIACTALLLLLGGMTWTFSTQLEYAAPSSPFAISEPSLASTTTVLEDISVPAAAPLETTVSSAPATHNAAFSPTRFFEANVFYLVAIWGLGVLVFTFRWCHMLLLTFRLRKRGARSLPPVWEERLLQLKRRMGVERIIGLVESNQIETPLVIGHLKPIILLPIGLVNGLSVAEVEAILAHELAHVRRHDFLVNLFLTGLEVVLFYHPVYWWLASRINEEREKCCDDVAVAACGNPRLYAHTLLAVEEHRQSGILAMAFAKEGGQLKNRIQRICRATPRQHHSLSLRFWFLLPLLGCAVAFAYAGVSPMVAEANNDDQVADLTNKELVSPASTVVAENLADFSTLTSVTEEETLEALPDDDLAVALLPMQSIDSPVPLSTSGSRAPKLSVVVPNVVQATLDSLPRPFIPRMETDPSLPIPPKFLLTEKEIETLLANGEEGRSKLRAEMDDYRAIIDDWNNQVNQDYLKSWQVYRLRIMEAYEKWSRDLRAQSSDELTYALAHNEMSELFEDALDLSEDKIDSGEDAIENLSEREIEILELALKQGEKRLSEHRERMEVHSIRMGMHSTRMQIHSGRMSMHSGRMKFHSSKMQLHSDRMKSHKIIMAALEAELRKELVADGLLEKGDKYFLLEVTKYAVFFNKVKLDPVFLAPKYLAILARYGKGDLGDNDGNTFIIDLSENGRSIGINSRRH